MLLLSAMRKALGIDIDTWGATASFLCAIHCALVPLILSFGLLGGVSFLADPIWDVLFIGLAIILAGISLLEGYRKHHQDVRPLLWAGSGFILIAVGHTLLGHGVAGGLSSLVGGVCVAIAHLANYRACRVCKKCR